MFLAILHSPSEYTGGAGSVGLMASISSNSVGNLTKQVRSHEIAIAELDNLLSSRVTLRPFLFSFFIFYYMIRKFYSSMLLIVHTDGFYFMFIRFCYYLNPLLSLQHINQSHVPRFLAVIQLCLSNFRGVLTKLSCWFYGGWEEEWWAGKKPYEDFFCFLFCFTKMIKCLK